MLSQNSQQREFFVPDHGREKVSGTKKLTVATDSVYDSWGQSGAQQG